MHKCKHMHKCTHFHTQDNVLLGAPLIPELYKEALSVAQLGADLELLPNGDLTEIGDRGITLSGGESGVLYRKEINNTRSYLFNPDSTSDLVASRCRPHSLVWPPHTAITYIGLFTTTTHSHQSPHTSPGQKQRVSIARAVYAQADVYLLDDPLSAVDSHVGRALFEKCIRGPLRNKTIILVGVTLLWFRMPSFLH